MLFGDFYFTKSIIFVKKNQIEDRLCLGRSDTSLASVFGMHYLIVNKMNMTKIQETLAALPEEKKELFEPVFENVDTFYSVIYLIARNEHLTDLEKPDRYEERLLVIRKVRYQAEKIVDSFGLDGAEIVADIASDYFEDFVNYKEPEIKMTNDEFIGIIRKIGEACPE